MGEIWGWIQQPRIVRRTNDSALSVAYPVSIILFRPILFTPFRAARILFPAVCFGIGCAHRASRQMRRWGGAGRYRKAPASPGGIRELTGANACWPANAGGQTPAGRRKPRYSINQETTRTVTASGFLLPHGSVLWKPGPSARKGFSAWLNSIC